MKFFTVSFAYFINALPTYSAQVHRTLTAKVAAFVVHLIELTQPRVLRFLLLFNQLLVADLYELDLLAHSPIVQLLFIELVETLLIQLKGLLLIKLREVVEEEDVVHCLLVHEIVPVLLD